MPVIKIKNAQPAGLPVKQWIFLQWPTFFYLVCNKTEHQLRMRPHNLFTHNFATRYGKMFLEIGVLGMDRCCGAQEPDRVIAPKLYKGPLYSTFNVSIYAPCPCRLIGFAGKDKELCSRSKAKKRYAAYSCQYHSTCWSVGLSLHRRSSALHLAVLKHAKLESVICLSGSCKEPFILPKLLWMICKVWASAHYNFSFRSDGYSLISTWGT